MAASTKNRYYVRRTTSEEWKDISANDMFKGCYILTLDGMNSQGEAVNVYSSQWTDSQTEDFMVTTKDGQDHDVIIRKNIDLMLTFICGTRYGALDTQQVHDAFVDYVTKHGDFYIKSKYTGKEAHVVCLKGYKPTTQKLQRGVNDSYIMGTIELHTLDMPQNSSPDPILGDLYIGFGGATLGTMTDVNNLANKQHLNKSSAAGNYQIVCPSTSYLWICFTGTIGMVTANGFEVPMIQSTSIGNLRCYRTYNAIVPHTMNFSIT